MMGAANVEKFREKFSVEGVSYEACATELGTRRTKTRAVDWEADIWLFES